MALRSSWRTTLVEEVSDDISETAFHNLPRLQRSGVRPRTGLGRDGRHDRGGAGSAGLRLRGVRRCHLRQLFGS